MPPPVNTDKATEAYWNSIWARSDVRRSAPHAKGLEEFQARIFYDFFRQLFGPMDARGKKLLEVGCARSFFLPYLAKEYGFEVSGLDYSPLGCELEREILQELQVSGEIFCANLFSPPQELPGKFDVVMSFGVVEHFTDTADVLGAIARFLKPGGLMLTSIPNLAGIIGAAQKRLSASVYDKHVPLNREALRKAHEDCGLQVLDSTYYGPLDFGICVLDSQPSAGAANLLKILRYGSAAWMLLESKLGRFPANRLTASFIFCTARRRADAQH